MMTRREFFGASVLVGALGLARPAAPSLGAFYRKMFEEQMLYGSTVVEFYSGADFLGSKVFAFSFSGGRFAFEGLAGGALGSLKVE